MLSKGKSYKTRLIIYFFIAITLVMIIASSFLYMNVRNVMDNETVKWNLNTIVQLRNSTEMMLDQIDHSLNQLSFDSGIQSFANLYDQATYKDIGEVVEKITNTSAANTYITSLYIYYFKTNQVLDAKSSNFISLDSLDNKDFISKTWKLFNKETALKQFNFYVVKSSANTDILTIVKPVNISSMQPEALLIVTVDPNYLGELLNSIKINEKASVYVTTYDGNVISKMNEQYPEFIKQSDLKKMTIVENNNSGYFISKIDGQDYLITFATSQCFGWKYYYTIPTKEIYRKINFIREYMIILFILCLLLGGVVSLLFATRLYVPIYNIINELRKNNLIDEKGFHDDITYIDTNVKSLISHNRSLEVSLGESIPILKNSFLQRLLKNEISNDETLWDSMKFYGIQIMEGCFYCICVVEIDQYDSPGANYTEKQTSMLEIYQKEIINDICSKEAGVRVELVKSDTNKLVMILSISCSDEQEANSRIPEITSKVHLEISRNMKFTVTIGVGKAYNDADRIHDTYSEACRALGYKVIKGNNIVISVEDVPEIQNWQYVYPYDIEKEIFTQLKQGNGDGVLAALGKYFVYTQKNITSSTDVKYAFIHLFDSTVRCIVEMSIVVNEVITENDNLYRHIAAQETIHDAYEWFMKLYKDIIVYINEKKEKKGDEIVSKVIEYIEKNYSSPLLDLDMISDMLHFSSSYLGKLFREYTGKSIKEYIIDKRIEIAIHLLEQTDVKVKRIGEKVGYQNDKSFINIFKKYTGETPGEYRNHRLKGIV